MPAGVYNIEVDQGETFSRVITWKDSAGTPVDLTGFTARMQVRKSPDAADPLVTLTSSSGGGIALGGTDGTITLTIPDTATAALPPGAAKYDLELVGGGVVTKLLRGQFTVSQEITR